MIFLLYDAWNLIAELNGNSGNALVRSYTWGIDVSKTMEGAGGVGGLLMVNAGNGGVHFPAYDLNSNAMGLVKAADGTVSATYEYGPFGERVSSTGTMAEVNPFRYSTKYCDSETDLLYYGYRYYSPTLGRWISRDPIEEQGGLNLYAFVNNDPVNKWDKLGMVDPSECGIKVYREDASFTLQNPFGDLGIEKEYFGLISPFDISFGHEWIEVSGSQYGFWPDNDRFLGTLYSPVGKIDEDVNRPEKSTLLTQWDVECRNKDTFIDMMSGTLHPHGYIPLRNSFKTRTEDAKLQEGKGKNKTCCCADCDDLKECIANVANQWKQGHYYCPTPPLAQNCRDFVSDALNKCALKKGRSSQLTSGSE